LRIERYLGSTGAVALALGIGLLLKHFIAVQSISLLFLTAVLAAAIVWGLWPSLFAAVLSVLAYNFFFLPPLYTFTVADPENVLALFFFLIVAVIVSNLTAKTRSQVLTARSRANTTAELYAFSRKVAGIGALDDLLWATAYQISSMLNVRTVLLMPVKDGDGLEVASGYPPEDQIDDADMAAARWTWEHNRSAGRGADTFPGGKRLFLSLRTGRGPVGVLGIDRDTPGPLLTPDDRRLLDALCDQAAVAIERISLAKGLDEALLGALRTEPEARHSRSGGEEPYPRHTVRS
jgi:two-component system sensor histidine kinase KdpD